MHIDAIGSPLDLERGLGPGSVERHQRDDRLDMLGIARDQVIALGVGQPANLFIAERDRLDLDRLHVVLIVMHVDRGLQHGPVAILPCRRMPQQIGDAECFPSLSAR